MAKRKQKDKSARTWSLKCKTQKNKRSGIFKRDCHGSVCSEQEIERNRKAPFLGVTAIRQAFELAFGMPYAGRAGTWRCSGWRVLRTGKRRRR